MIDCHVHLWDPAHGFGWIRPDSPHHRPFTASDLEQSGRDSGELAGRAVLVEASRGDDGETAALRALRLRRPDLVAGYVANLHVHGEQGPDRFRTLLDAWGDSRPNGMRLGGATWARTPGPARTLVPVLAETGLALELNLYRGAFTAAAEAAERHPGLTVVVDHLGNAPHLDADATDDATDWRRDLERAAACPNVLVKISGLLTQQHGVAPHRVAGLVRDVVDTLGADRCLVGSDWPICLPRGSRADSLNLSLAGLDRLTADERARALHTNAVRAYGLNR
ncbi:amidohydrolase [Streptomyces sp. VRA16 Mangrove soil]|uniref:amidohydrolase family protein n=1 Tax=Streptomyces sp. VRA16 Mangrove soil TaxID=2817434 RepID=UPI001A9D0005|nr:amidohydrolase family protein [Streptomyces sp. VRA16 Mangrove soil]MBO1331435.1 amidohydrolase [Streptomyces sp. VRA16 Mangrove soil]